MWKTVRICEKLAVQLKKVPVRKRTFLSDAYRCDEAWNKRLSTPILQNVNLENFYIAVSQKFNQEGKAHPIDIDIFANVVTDSTHELDELSDLLYKLRLTTETRNMLDSTHHAVVRSFLKSNRIDDLLRILHDRLNYGVFPDHHVFNILMDSLVKQKDYASAARTAVLLMLQEDAENQISNSLALYSCYMFLKNPEGWSEPEPPVDTSKEEIKIRVKFLRNPYFDDHFDLQKPTDLVGKTLAFYGKNLGDSLGRSFQLIGLTTYRKYDAAAALISEWVNNGVRQVVYEDAVRIVKDNVTKILENEQNNAVEALNKEIDLLQKLDLVKGNLDEVITNEVKNVVNQQAEKDISAQIQLYDEWNKRRQEVMEQQLADIDRQKRLANVEAIKKDLESKERILTFFEREEQIDLEIENRRIKYKKRWFGKKKTSRVVDQEYIPPEVGSRNARTQ